MNILEKLIVSFVLTIFLFSCSSSNTVKRNELIKREAYESIETERDTLLKRYKEMRMKNWDRYTGKKPANQVRPTQNRAHIKIKPNSYPPKKQKGKKRNLVNLDEQKIEISQLFEYSCIKNRLEIEQCEERKNDAEKNCHAKNLDWGETEFTSCIKSELKKVF